MAANLVVTYQAGPVQKQELTAAATQDTPTVVIPPSNSVQTLIMFDPDSAHPDYLHWLVTDIPVGGGVTDGNTVWSYTPPAPIAATGIDIQGRKAHRYYFALFNGSIGENIPQVRGKFPTKDFQMETGLTWTTWNGFWVFT